MASTTETVIRISAKDETSRAFNSVNASMRKTQKEMSGTTKQLRFMRGGFGQVGHQVQDIAVQLQMGQNAMLIFGQQGSQIASLFGPHGAIIGAFLAVGAALSTALLPAIFDSKDALEELKDAQDSLNKVFKTGKGDVFTITEEYLALSRAASGIAELQVASAVNNAAIAVRASVQAIRDSLEVAAGDMIDWGSDVTQAMELLVRLETGVKGARESLLNFDGERASVGDLRDLDDALGDLMGKFKINETEAVLLLETLSSIKNATPTDEFSEMAKALSTIKGNTVFDAYINQIPELLMATDLAIRKAGELKEAIWDSSGKDQGFKKALKAPQEDILAKIAEKKKQDKLEDARNKQRLDSAQLLLKESQRLDKEAKKQAEEKLRSDKKLADQAFNDRALTSSALMEEADRLIEEDKRAAESHARKSESAENAAHRIIIAAMSEMKQVGQLAEDARDKIESDNELGLLTEETYKQSLLAIESKYLEDIGAIQLAASEEKDRRREEEHAKDLALLEAKKAIGQETVQSAKGVFASLSSSMEQGTAAQKAMFAIEKVLAISSILINTEKAAIAAAANDAALGGFLGFMASSSAVRAVGYASAGVVAGTALASFEGGGFTGNGIRAGGLDGKGGKIAMVHPNEKIIDMEKGGDARAVNVTFNIQANDTKGFDQLLASRRGTIVGIINQAMNNRGRAGVA